MSSLQVTPAFLASLPYLSMLFIAILGLRLQRSKHSSYNDAVADLSQLPGPPSLSLLNGYLTPDESDPALLSDAGTRAAAHYGENVYARGLGFQRTLITSDAGVARHVLHSHAHRYGRIGNQRRLIDLLIGPGLVNAAGDLHRRYRKVAMPAFSVANLNNNAAQVYGVADSLIRFLNKRCDGGSQGGGGGGGGVVDMHDAFGRATLDSTGKVGFQYDFQGLQDDGQHGELKAAIDSHIALLSRPSMYRELRYHVPGLADVGQLVGWPEERTLRASRERIHRVARTLVDEAKARTLNEASVGKEGGATIKRDTVQGTDLLSQLVRSNLGSDTRPSQRIDDAAMAAMVPDFFFAGLDTTNGTMCWALYALTRGAERIAMQQRLRRELDDNPGWRDNWRTLDALPYLDAVMRETMRLYPVAQFVLREASEAEDVVQLGNPVIGRDGRPIERVRLRKGDAIQISVHGINTSETYWGADAEQFRPQRWLEGDVTGAGVGWSQLMTFSVGPKACIGIRLAVMQFKIFFANVIVNFDAEPTRDIVHKRTFFTAKPSVAGKGYQMPVRLRAL